MNARAVAVALAAVLALTGCAEDTREGHPTSSDPNGRIVTFDVNGRTVSCIVINPPGDALAMSCDWTREASR